MDLKKLFQKVHATLDELEQELSEEEFGANEEAEFFEWLSKHGFDVRKRYAQSEEPQK